MAVVPQDVRVYPQFALGLGQKVANLGSDSLGVLLMSTYTLSTAHKFVSDVLGAGTEANGTGYSSGGVTLTGVAWQVFDANSWPVVYATATAYNVSDVVRPSSGNGFVYRCAVAGTSAGSAPTWPTTVGLSVTDGSVTWTCAGRACGRLTASSPTWPSSTISGVNYAVFFDKTPGSNATNPVMVLWDFSNSPQSSSAGTFTLAIPASGIIPVLIP